MAIHWTSVNRVKRTDKGACSYRIVSCSADTVTELILDMIADKPKTSRRRK